MNIEFGCGENPTKAGFKTCDIRNVTGIDFVCTAWDIDKLVEEDSVDTIFSRHFFEHLTFAQGEKMLEVWHKILKPGGKCEMMLPNMTFHMQQWLTRSTLTDIEHANAGFWGWQRGTFDDVWDVHKSGYDEELLIPIIKKYKFVNITSHKSTKNKHIHLSFYKE
jgi:predicted SAM-dependent methyltransferase